MSIKQLNVLKWAREASPGERIVYAQGSGYLPPVGQHISMETAMMAHEEGLVFLAQRRDGCGMYDYEATRVSAAVARMLGIQKDSRGIVL